MAVERRLEPTAKVAFLLRRAFPRSPEVIETHWSWVFLTEDRAYKLKKPVRTPFLDHRRPQARRADCEAEVALNRPLAPGVYLGVVPLTWEASGHLALDGAGDEVDWLVVMRRLPAEAMLDHRLRHGRVDASELESVMRHLVAFYGSTDAAARSPEAHRAVLQELLGDDRDELLRADYLLDADRLGRLVDGLHAAIDVDTGLVERAGRVVDGHGDLRPEHVVVVPRPVVIDRITFDRRLRLRDPLDDLALLSVECEMLGAPDVGDLVITSYQRAAGDDAPPATVALYRSLRAITRARLSIAHLRDGDHGAHRWHERTDAYIAIAERTIETRRRLAP